MVVIIGASSLHRTLNGRNGKGIQKRLSNQIRTIPGLNLHPESKFLKKLSTQLRFLHRKIQNPLDHVVRRPQQYCDPSFEVPQIWSESGSTCRIPKANVEPCWCCAYSS